MELNLFSRYFSRSPRAAATLIALCLLSACAVKPPRGANIGPRFDDDTYSQLINKYTRHDAKFDGLNQLFDVYATMQTTEVQAAILQKRSDIYEWTPSQAQDERDKMFQNNSTQTRFAVSFFVPNTRLNDLNRKTTMWRFYLDSQGKRYVGTATKRKDKFVDLNAMYPYHTRFYKPYEFTFNVPLSVIESAPAMLTIASAEGVAHLKFAPQTSANH